MSWETGDERTVTYVPRRDRWVTMLLWATALLVAWSAFWGTRDAMEPAARLGLSVLYGAVILLCIAPLYTLAYTLSRDRLRVGFGPIGMNVPLADIQRVAPGVKAGLTISWSMALKGLIIERSGRKWAVMISPLNQGDFLRDLAERCPHLTLRDGALWPADNLAKPSSE